MIKKITFWSLGLLMGLALFACDSGTDSGAAVASGDLVGKWYLRKLQAHSTMSFKGNIFGQAVDTTSQFDTTETFTGTQYFVEFKAEGNAFTSVFPDDLSGSGEAPKRAASLASTETGTWSVSGDVLTLNGSDGTTEKIKVAISGNTLTGTQTTDTTSTESGLTVHQTGTNTLTFQK
jgi:hypothetical protein